MKEIWKDIVNYETFYEISNLGNIRNYKTKKILCVIINRHTLGYRRVALYKNGKSKKYKVARLVGIAFIPNPENKSQINHIKDKSDDRVYSLEWSTQSENMRHAVENKLNGTNKKTVLMYDKNMKLLKEFESATKAKEYLKLPDSSGISFCCKNGKVGYGYFWKYKNKDNKIILKYNDKGKLLNRFTKIIDAVNDVGGTYKQITYCCKGMSNTAYGYIWIWEKDKEKYTKQDIIDRFYRSSLRFLGKPVIQYNLKGNFIKKFDSQTKASIKTGCSRDGIGRVCSGRANTCGGYMWSFEKA